jgi:aspartyl-tRNA(Asn)/glutamyl-tRNA(Gln) amidotransferase subunit B
MSNEEHRMEYEAVIGIEAHVELATESKMFCGCSAEFFGREPNTHVCPICMGYPGVLPVVNERAVAHAVRVGLALNCQVASFSKFDRKNYTYPDLPKGYQISQYDLPICSNGWIDIEVDGQPKCVRIRRVHLEEDTAKETHVGPSSLVDFNRSGVPLLEIVTEPDLRSGKETRQFLIKLRSILRALGVSTADMEKGAMRCEPNVSVHRLGDAQLGVKTEIKNLNSFRSAKLAIEYEVERQIQVLESGRRVEQVTMGWNERDKRTVVQRSKEYAQDYRYFPEPDLPPLELASEYVAEIKASLPELPDARRERFVQSYGLRESDAEVLASDRDTAAFFEEAVAAAEAHHVAASTVANWVLGELFRLLGEQTVEIGDSPVTPLALTRLLQQVETGVVTANTAKTVLAEMFQTGQSPETIIAEHGLDQISDPDRIESLVEEAIRDNPGPLQQYLEGKDAIFGFFMGQVMRASRGRADPQTVRETLTRRLERLRDGT